MTTYAPTPKQGESPQAYVLRVCEYLTEPQRRRLGSLTAMYVAQAVSAMDETAPSADTLVALLSVLAEQPIEEMADYDSLRAALDTAEDLAERIRGVLKEAKMWWSS